MQSADEAAARAADADWDRAVEQYEAALDVLRPELSESFRQLLDGFQLHDARILSMGRRGDLFTISLQLDVPPRELLTITCTLAGDPVVRKEPLPWVTDPSHPHNLLWLFDELSQAGPGQPIVHSILLSNGWELDLPCRDVHLATAYPVIPAPSERQVPAQA
jgi:hypothetical protein